MKVQTARLPWTTFCLFLFIYLLIYLFSFFPVGRGTLLQVSPITAGPFVQVCSGGGNSPQHRHLPTLIDKCVGSFKSPDRKSRLDQRFNVPVHGQCGERRWSSQKKK